VGDGKVGVAGGADRRSSTVDTLCQSSLQQQSVRGRQMSLLSLLLRARGEFFACFTSYNFYFPTPALLMLINWMWMGLEVGGSRSEVLPRLFAQINGQLLKCSGAAQAKYFLADFNGKCHNCMALE